MFDQKMGNDMKKRPRPKQIVSSSGETYQSLPIFCGDSRHTEDDTDLLCIFFSITVLFNLINSNNDFITRKFGTQNV